MRTTSRYTCALVITALSLFVTEGLHAQPFGAWLTLNGTNTQYARAPHAPALNFTTAFTYEAWISLRDTTGGCSSIAGKHWQEAWWIGVCGTSLRSYLRGSGSAFTQGTIPANDWTHIAVTWDGTTHKHYIDGELVGSQAETGNMTTSTTDMRIGSDVVWEYTPTGAIDEMRLWNVARTQAEIRANINKPLSSGTGLVAAYHFDGNVTDSAGSNSGNTIGGAGFLTFPAGGTCTSSATTLCTESGRYQITADYMTSAGARGQGKVATGLGATTANSGIFWFFDAANYELLVKTLNGCSVNNRKWVLAAATTDVHYELTVFDTQGLQSKKYFNYLGSPAPAVVDTGAFNTCP